MPHASSLSNNNLCGRQSKALDRSISTAAMYLFTTSSTLYNYADDNNLAHADDNIDKVVEYLEKDSLALIEWLS
jgi:hypothetical protein